MTPAIAILAHSNLNRVAQVAKFLSASGLHVAIHVDQNVPAERYNKLKSSLFSCPDILWAKRIECQWGHFSLVEATLGMSAEILSKWPDAGHVMLISGGSLPIRPPSELITFLRENPDVDFIESVSIGKNNWITGGLGIERFTLTFPFSWKKQRWLFDRWVDVQRKLRIKRRIPNDIHPHIGSQWWCLSRRTLKAILTNPLRPKHDAYFRKCWIPDESYFQTLARKHAHTIESRALLFSRFDHQGKPTIFYDDHAELISSIDAFFVRKVWNGANGLYQRFLSASPAMTSNNSSSIPNFSGIEKATNRRKTGRNGLYMHGRAPSQWHDENSPTAAPYHVFTSFRSIFSNFDDWLETRNVVRPHGRLFAKSGIEYVDGKSVGPGGLSISATIRDFAPENYLCSMVWNTREQGLGFHYEICDLPKIGEFLLADPHANLHFIHYGWMLDLLNRGIENGDFLRTEATAMVNSERRFITALKQTKTTCNYNVWTLGEVLSNPLPALSAVLGETGTPRPLALPVLIDATPLHEFARHLKNIGVDIDTSLLEPSLNTIQTESGLQARQ